MFKRFTNNVIKVIVFAQEEARQLGQSHVGTQHILLGLLGDRGGPAEKLLREAGIKIKETRIKVEGISVLGQGSVPITIPFTPRANSVFELAGEAAHKMGEDVDAQHILIGIIDEGSGKAFDLLTQSGVNVQALREKATRARRDVLPRACGPSKRPPLSKDDRAQFFDVFLVEIGKIMNYSMGLKDALFLVVNILGRALRVSRCLIILEKPESGRQYYEYCQEKVKSVSKLDWPERDSLLIAQTLMAEQPLILIEGDTDSNVLSMQNELRLLQAKSYFSILLQGQQKFLGCLILQQCDRSRNWIIEDDVSWIQNVATEISKVLVDRSDEIGK